MLRRAIGLTLLFGLGSIVGCTSTPDPRLTGAIRYVNIREDPAPRQLIAQVGDEIRWQNLNQHPVRLRLLDDLDSEAILCETGFLRLGVMQDSVTIPPLQYARLCLAKATTLRFNVWLDADNPQGAITPTGTVRIERLPPRRSF